MTTTPTDPPRVVATCSACHTLIVPLPHCDTSHGCAWWVCGNCAAANDGAGHWNPPKRHDGNHRAVLGWAAEHGIKQEFTEKGKTA